MFLEDLKNFAKQFEWKPVIENSTGFGVREKIVVLGMGGSHLAADLLKTWTPYVTKIKIHSDYGLPALSDQDIKNSLVVAVSHSGQSQEVLDGFNLALEKGYAVGAISAGGELIKLAQKKSVPYILIPDSKIQPRLATGFYFRALLKIMGETARFNETEKLTGNLRPAEFELRGKELAKKIKGRLPIIYSSAKKSALAYIWKVKFNETAKSPAFYNVFPELNHNELAGFEVSSVAGEFVQKFFFIFLADSYDHPQNQKRMAATAGLLEKAGFLTETIQLAGQDHFHKIFSAALLADWASYHLAQLYGVDPESVPVVEAFKKTI